MKAKTALAALLLAGALLASGSTWAAPSAALADLGAEPSEGRLTFTLPAGHKLIGYAKEGGGFALAVVPLDAPTPRVSATGLEPAHECTNDIRNGYGTSYPLTASPTAGVVPNLASAGACNGARGLTGPVVYLSFYTTGDHWGGVQLWSMHQGSFTVSCAPAMTFAGAGVYDVWTTTLLYDETSCSVTWSGVPPSQYFGWQGTVQNGHRDWGTTSALVLAY
ncbi:MAG TPA: hypothetical protein VNX21_09345 [Candidatus Thermoplasmatota archaeon]|nr:hypothetical protein [Candidatus Thermoplasmatota archaeon]